VAVEADWVLVPGAEAAEQAAAAPRAGAAAPAVREVCGRLANLVRQPVVGRVVAVRAQADQAGDLEVVGRVVEVETAAVALVVEAARAAAADQVQDLEVVGRVVEAGLEEVEAEPEEAEGLVAVPARPANLASGWPRQRCLREACWEEFRA